MELLLRPMTNDIFAKYINKSIKKYANEHVKAGNWIKEDSLERAEKEFKKLLPEGLKTKKHYLFSVTHEKNNIGVLWLNIYINNNIKQAFIYDIELEEEYQGKGYGKQTMNLLDKYLKENDVDSVQLHVFAHNERAVSLYKKMGYKFTDFMMIKYL